MDNREKAYEKRRAKKAENPDKERAYWQRYRETHREYLRGISTRSRYRHPETMRAYISRRRLREKATPTDRKAVAHLIKSQRGKCYWCKQKFTGSPHLDHVWPLYLGGSGGAENLVLACQSCNTRKNKKSPIEFAQQLL